MNKLAIVIPAYKIDFFKETLKSLAAQTCKDFTVYVGDDCSPSDFGVLIEVFKDRLDIVYKKFDTNLGGKDLVAHWGRCIALTQGEPWIWLFSDDDIMGERCVELFYKEIADGAMYDIYHYDVEIIDPKGKIIYKPRKYPEVIDIETLYKESSKDNIRSFVVENIFSRTIYEKVGGFEPFPMAWGSDMATWLKMGKEKGLKTIVGDIIYWRRSDKNITPSKERPIVKRKFYIQIDYYKWINSFFNAEQIINFNRYVFVRYCVHYSNQLSLIDFNELMNYGVSNKIIQPIQKYATLPIIPMLRVAQKIKNIIQKKNN